MGGEKRKMVREAAKKGRKKGKGLERSEESEGRKMEVRGGKELRY